MAGLIERFRSLLEKLKKIRATRNTMTFIGFVALAAMFWLVMTMNDNVQENLEVRLEISNVPDTVTFISIPPENLHVAVRDRATTLMRIAMFQTPRLILNYRDYAQDGIFRVSKGDFIASVKQLFGANAAISALNIDSLHLIYTTNPGKRVPVVVDYKVSVKNGMVAGNPKIEPSVVKVYSGRNILDTVMRVVTENINRRNLEEDTRVEVNLRPIPGARIIPNKVTVTIPVEPLVRKTQTVNIECDNVPEGMELLLFPQSARVVYYLQMSRFNEPSPNISVRANYNEMVPGSNKLPLHIMGIPNYLYNVELENSSVEYTIVSVQN